MYSTKLRIETIASRTSATVLPKIDEVFRRSKDLNIDLPRTFVDQFTFSDYPGIHSDGAAIIDTFLMNKRNIDKLKSSGSLGAIVEGFRRISIEKECNSEIVENLVHSLNLLTDGDIPMQQKLLQNFHSITILKQLCFYCVGTVQIKAFVVLERLSRLQNGIDVLLKNDIFSVLFSPELMFRPSTSTHVRHGTCQLINRISAYSAVDFPVIRFMELIIDKHEIRKVDGYMEMQLLSALLHHLTYLDSKGETLTFVLKTLKHLITEIVSETFENLEHLQQIVKCWVILSKDPKQAIYMLDHSLNMALQFLVKTDFSLYRRKTATSGSPSKVKAKMMKIQKSTKRLSIQDTGERPHGTLLALSLIRPDIKVNRNDDVNYIATKAVIAIFENIINYRIETIADIVSSGLIPSLLFRVGKGSDRDARFNKIVVHFIFQILHKVIVSQPLECPHLSLLDGSKFSEYCRFSKVNRIEVVATSPVRNNGASKHNDIRGISNTIHAQGVTALLFINIQSTEDIGSMQVALIALSYMNFTTISSIAFEHENLSKVVHLCGTRNECFFPALQIIVNAMLFPEVAESILEYMVSILKVTKILIRALKLSGWEFPIKSQIYCCLGRSAHITGFRDLVVQADGVGVLAHEVLLRKSTTKSHSYGYRAVKNPVEDEHSERIYSILRRDINAIRIQSLIRKVIAKTRVNRIKLSRR